MAKTKRLTRKSYAAIYRIQAAAWAMEHKSSVRAAARALKVNYGTMQAWVRDFRRGELGKSDKVDRDSDGKARKPTGTGRKFPETLHDDEKRPTLSSRGEQPAWNPQPETHTDREAQFAPISNTPSAPSVTPRSSTAASSCQAASLLGWIELLSVKIDRLSVEIARLASK